MARRSDHTREELYELALGAAERIAEAEGLQGLTVRKVAGEIGYSHGTLYNLFADLDDLIVHLNGRTLDLLYDALQEIPVEGEPDAGLLRLAEAYIAFTRRHASRWALLFEHRLPEGRQLPDWHYEKIRRLLKLAETPLAPLFSDGQQRERMHSARVLWSALHGICSLEASRKLGGNESVESLSRTLITFYIGGLVSAKARARPT